MKKLLSVLVVVIMCFALVGCGLSEQEIADLEAQNPYAPGQEFHGTVTISNYEQIGAGDLSAYGITGDGTYGAIGYIDNDGKNNYVEAYMDEPGSTTDVSFLSFYYENYLDNIRPIPIESAPEFADTAWIFDYEIDENIIDDFMPNDPRSENLNFVCHLKTYDFTCDIKIDLNKIA